MIAIATAALVAASGAAQGPLDFTAQTMRMEPRGGRTLLDGSVRLSRGGMVVTGDRAVYAIDAQTGKLRWKLVIPSYDSVSSPIIQGNLIYFGGAHPYRVYAVNIDTHRIAWQTDLPHVIGASSTPMRRPWCSPATARKIPFCATARRR